MPSIHPSYFSVFCWFKSSKADWFVNMKVWQGKPFMYFCGFSQISAFKSRAKNNIAWKSVEEQDQTGLLNKFLEGFSAFHKINDIKKDQMNQNPGSDFNPWNPLIFLRIHRISLRSKQKIFSRLQFDKLLNAIDTHSTYQTELQHQLEAEKALETEEPCLPIALISNESPDIPFRPLKKRFDMFGIPFSM